MFRIIAEGLDYREHVLLKDGQGVLLRPATPMRFMASVSEVPEQIIVDMCSTDLTDRGCLLAVTGEGDEEKVVGLGNYVGLGNGKTAEVAFLVADEYQGRGISTTILERLAGLAAAQGYVEFEAEGERAHSGSAASCGSGSPSPTPWHRCSVRGSSPWWVPPVPGRVSAT